MWTLLRHATKSDVAKNPLTWDKTKYVSNVQTSCNTEGNNMKRHLIFVAAAFGFACAANAADGFGKSEGKIGRWSLYSEADSMTDKKQCTALYDDRSNIQLTLESLAIGFDGRGGIQGYKLRLDDAVAGDIQLPTDDEKQLQVVFVNGSVYEKVKASKRLRLQAITILNTIVDEDIDMSTYADIQGKFVQLGCSS